jgi:hypothetical protein
MILFIGMVFTPSTVSKVEQSPMSTLGGDILYVGGSGEGNYTRIIDAIADAESGLGYLEVEMPVDSESIFVDSQQIDYLNFIRKLML